MAAYKNIIFDLGGVILNIDFNKTIEAFKALGLNKIDRLFGLGHAASYFKEYEVGKISDDEFIEKIRESLSETTEKEKIIAAWNAMLLEFPPERVEKLKALKKKYRTFLFSNTNSIHLRAFSEIFQSTYPGDKFEDLFEKVYYSHLLEARKPDLKAFRKILNENSLAPEETLFVDDAEVNLEGARAAGMQTLLIAGEKTILELE